MITRLSVVTALLMLAAGPSRAGEVRFEWKHQFTSATTVRVWADVLIDAPPGFVGFGGTLFDVVGIDSGASRGINFDEGSGLGRIFRTGGPAQRGTLVGTSITGIDEFQSPQAFNPAFNPSATIAEFFAFEYTFTDLTPRTVSFTSTHDYVRIYAGPLGAQGANQAIGVSVEGTAFTFQGASVVPMAPAGATGLVGLAVLAMHRRRRWQFR